ncbi:lipoprotein [Salinisphaera sp. C84B14]|uniref:DUF302 domain-containing protein n=1 Tax=Salinisphaera sp. C84B14 TaxID=1304155 RepID=UPI00333F67FF
MRAIVFPARLLLLVALAIASAAGASERARYDRTAPADKAFVDVVLDLEQSIGQHNFALVGRNDIGDAVRRRGHAQFGDATIVHFCNLEYARRVIEIEPSLILYMPCRIAIFENNERIHVATLLLPTTTDFDRFNTLATQINTQLRQIIDAAVAPMVAPVDPG